MEQLIILIGDITPPAFPYDKNMQKVLKNKSLK